MGNLGFNVDDQDTSQSSTVPLGIYELEVSETDIKETKAGTGDLLSMTIDVLAPESQKGRKIFYQLNIRNSNPTAQKIGQEELAKMSRAMGIKPDDHEELRHIRFTARVGLEKKQDGYDQKNKLSRYYYPDEGDLPEPKLDDTQPKPANDNRRAANDNSTARPAAAAAPATRTAAAGGKSTPWAR